MKKRITLILAALMLATASLIALTGCGDMTRPNPVTREKFDAAITAQGLESYAEEHTNGIVVDLSGDAYVYFYEFATDALARGRFNWIDGDYRGTRTSSVEVNMGGYQMRRFTSQGFFVRLYRLDNVVVYASGRVADRGAIDAFMALVIIRD